MDVSRWIRIKMDGWKRIIIGAEHDNIGLSSICPHYFSSQPITTSYHLSSNN
jgi:hypothetical protein